nr:MAG TPA: hypothetical protein [Caudoviricetes sp.]
MTDLEKVLKNSLHNFKKAEQVCKQFCCNTIILTATTFERVSKNYSESKGNMIDKIYKVEVVIDGRVVFEHYGKDAKEMNNQYLLALNMCEG